MRRIICTILAFLIALCICGCNKPSDTGMKKKDNIDNSQSNTDSQNNDENDTVVVPNVVGTNKDEAVKKIEELGLKCKPKFKRLQVKEFSGENIIYYDDNSVVEQSHKGGTVVVVGTEIEISINQNVSEMEYTVNSDNTITFTELGDTLYYPDRKFFIPKEYDGYKVSHVNSGMLNDFLKAHTSFNVKYYIPQDVIIDGDTSAEIIRY